MISQTPTSMPDRSITRVSLQAVVPIQLSGKRLDQAAAQLFPDYSRARLQQWIRNGDLLVNGKAGGVSDKVFTGDNLAVEAELQASEDWSAESMTLDIVYEDEDLLIVNKPAGTVVHPAAGHRAGTLLNGLLHHCARLEEIPRAGIVHRLDKDTTGLMAVAKTLPAHLALVKQLQARNVTREYRAIVQGVVTSGGVVNAPLSRHPVHRKKRAVVEGGKEAVTRYRVLQNFRAHSLLQLNLETGRTHQIRVHMSYLKQPIVGDPVYGRLQVPRRCSDQLAGTLRSFRRQALHARRIGLVHPRSGQSMSWEVDMPEDMQCLADALQADMV
ncbi:MAG: 23S rRNA pseudouridine(1911/1915/1917) synthase RluD [Pseudohongiellaceae bacterium]